MIRIQEMSKIIGVSVNTLRRWDNQGKIIAGRTPGGQRFYTEEQFNQMKEKGYIIKNDLKGEKNV